MKYVTEADVERYREIFREVAPRLATATNADLAALANWFADGAVTTLSNHLMGVFDESTECASLQYNCALGCRCGSCYEFQIVDDKNKVLEAAETLQDFIKIEIGKA